MAYHSLLLCVDLAPNTQRPSLIVSQRNPQLYAQMQGKENKNGAQGLLQILEHFEKSLQLNRLHVISDEEML